MTINPQKFLPISSSSSAIVKSVRGKVSSTKILKSNKPIKNLNDTIDFVNVRLIDIDTILKKNLLLQESIKKDQKKEDERNKFDKKEEELEKKEEKKKKVKLPFNVPSLGIFDRINRFITFTLLGWVVNKLFKYLPALLEFSKNIAPVIDFVEKFVGNVFNGVVNFIDLGYKSYGTVRNYTKQLGGEPFQKTFDAFSKNLNTFINLAIIAGVATTGGTDFGLGKKATKNVAEKEIGKTATRSFITKGARKSLVGTFGKGGTRTLLKSIKPLVGKLPLIGGLIEFGLSWALGDPIGKAAFRGIGATLIGAIGSVIGGPIGLFLGSWAGGEAGGALYDVIFNNKKKINGPNTEIKAKRTGGKVTTRSGKVVGGTIKRTLRKTLPSPKVRPIIPGASVGGKKEVQKIFPEPQGTQIGKSVNPFGFLKETTESMGQVPFLGPLFTLFGKVLLGQIPDKDDYSNIGLGINAWINNAIGKGFLRGNIIKGFNQGGLVDFETEMRQNISGWVEKSVEDLIKNKVTDAINELRKNLGMEPLTGTQDPSAYGAETQGGFSPTGIQKEIYEYLLSKGLDDNQSLGIMANIHRESGFRVDARQPDGPGIGLFQYSSAGRKDAFLKAVPNWTTNWKGQIDYALKDDVGPQYTRMKFSSPQEAADWWMREWERPAEYIQRGKGPRIHKEYLDSVPRSKGGKPNFPSNIQLGSEMGNLQLVRKIAESMKVPLYSHVRRDDPNSYHYDGRAMDFSNDAVGRGTPEQMNLAKELVKRFGSTAKEIIYTPLGFSIKDGKKVPPIDPSNHYHHVHVAFKEGGIIPDNNSIKPLKKTPNVKPLQSQTSYEKSTETIMIIQPVIVEKVIPTGKNKKTINFSGGGVNNNSKISQLSIR